MYISQVRTVNMWLKIGSFRDLDAAAEILSALERAGIKWDLKQCIDWEVEEKYFLRGKLSELKRFHYKEIKDWERYIKVIKEILRDGIKREEFEKNLFEKLGINDPIDRFLLVADVYNFLKMNGLKVNDVISGNLPDDPEIFVEVDEFFEGAKRMYVLVLVKSWDIYVDCLSLIKAKLNELKDNEDLYCLLDAVARMFANLMVQLLEMKTCKVEDLKVYSIGAVECLNNKLVVDAEDVLDEILKGFEKAGIIKRYKDKITLR